MITDLSGFQVTPSSPILASGVYEYEQLTPSKYCKVGMPHFCSAKLCARDCQAVNNIDISMVHSIVTA